MNTSRQAKIRSITVIVVAALLLELTMAVQYISTKHAVTAQIKEMAQRDLNSTNRTAKVKEVSEGCVFESLTEVERLLELGKEDSLHKVLQHLVAIHPEMISPGKFATRLSTSTTPNGAGIAMGFRGMVFGVNRT